MTLYQITLKLKTKIIVDRYIEITNCTIFFNVFYIAFMIRIQDIHMSSVLLLKLFEYCDLKNLRPALSCLHVYISI